jgi:hypothetical protein
MLLDTEQIRNEKMNGFRAVTSRSVYFGQWYLVDSEIRRVPLSIALPRRVSCAHRCAMTPTILRRASRSRASDTLLLRTTGVGGDSWSRNRAS